MLTLLHAATAGGVSRPFRADLILATLERSTIVQAESSSATRQAEEAEQPQLMSGFKRQREGGGESSAPMDASQMVREEERRLFGGTASPSEQDEYDVHAAGGAGVRTSHSFMLPTARLDVSQDL
jgi:hypothetical protein